MQPTYSKIATFRVMSMLCEVTALILKLYMNMLPHCSFRIKTSFPLAVGEIGSNTLNKKS